MKIRVTAITAEGLGKRLGTLTIGLQDRLAPHFLSKHYGGNIDQLTVFYIVLESDPIENEKYCVKYNRVGKYKDMVSGRFVNFLSFGIALDPQEVQSIDDAALRQVLATRMIEDAEAPMFAPPKAFAYKTFIDDLRHALMGI